MAETASRSRQSGLLLWLLALALLFSAAPAAAVGTQLNVAIYEEAPYQFVTAEGGADGLFVELFNEVAARAGYKAEYHRYPSIRECAAAVESGDADLVLGMPSAADHGLLETAELYASPLVIACRRDSQDKYRSGDGFFLAGYNYYTTDRVILYTMGADRYIISDRTSTLIDYLERGRLDAAVLDSTALNYALEQVGRTLDAVLLNDSLSTVKYTVACAPDNSALLRDLNTAILDLRISGNYSGIVSNWVREDNGAAWRLVLPWIMAAAGVIFVLFAVYFAVTQHIRRILERELEAKTHAMREANLRLEEQVRQLQFESDLRSKLIKNARSGMVIINTDHQIQLMNQSAKRMAGFSRWEEGTTIEELPCFREVLAQVEGDFFTPGFSVDNRQIAVPQTDGFPHYFRLNIHQIVEAGQINSALITLEDVTQEQRIAQARYEQDKNHALNRMIAGIAHEIKNPLMSIRTYASLIPVKMDDPEFRASFAEFVPREADRINRLVESLVSYARPAKGSKAMVDLCALVRECAYLSNVARRKKPIEVSLRAEGEAYICANLDQVRQAVINMMINGIEAMEERAERGDIPLEGLRLEVTVRREGENALLTVSDNGVGMSGEALRQCTSLFYTTKTQGTGMGLALSEQFIRENGGRLEISSREGEYTRVFVCFPLSRGPGAEKEGETL